jgi:tungstate transport system ATP-binding protein
MSIAAIAQRRRPHHGDGVMFPIRLKDLCFTPNGRAVLDGINLELGSDGISLVLGPNGAGKSVLLRMLAGLEQAHAGQLHWNGGGTPQGRIAMVFQQPMLLRDTVLANIVVGLKPLALPRTEREQRARTVLARVGLLDRATDSARLLSGGECQRLALARAWAIRPRLLLLDEPTAALDPSATEQVEAIIREIRTDGARIVMTTHNLGQAMRLADDIVFIDAGRIREHTAASRFFSRPQSPEAKLFMQGELPWRIAFND